MARVTLVEALPWDPATGAVVPVRLAGGGRRHSRHKGHADWLAGIVDAPVFTAGLEFDGSFTGGAVPSSSAIGFMPARADARARIARLMWNGAPIVVSTGDDAATVPVWTVELNGKVAGYSVQRGAFTFTVANLVGRLNDPLVTATFTGKGGIEGSAQAAGRLKRRTWGRAWSVEGRLLDAPNNIYEFGDPAHPIRAFDAVKDKGRAGPAVLVEWAGSIDATLAALKVAAAPKGGCAAAPSINCVKWWMQPSVLTADIRGEVGTGYVETVAGVAAAISAAAGGPAVVDLAAAIAARPEPAGLHVEDASERGVAALDRVLLRASMGWEITPAGALAMAPIAFDAPIADIVANSIEREAAYAPVSSVSVGWRRNHRRHNTSEISAAVTAGDVTFEDGRTVEDLKPATPGATAGAPNGTTIGGTIQLDGTVQGGKPAADVIAAIDAAKARQDTLENVTIPAVDKAVKDAGDRITAARQDAAKAVADANVRIDGAVRDFAAEVDRAQGADEALTRRIDVIVAEGGYDDTDVRALISSEATVRADDDRALGRRVDTVSASVKSGDDAVRADVKVTTDALARADAAFAEQARLIEASLGTVDNRIAAKAQEVTTAYADADRALGRRIDSIVAEGGYDDRDVRAEISRVDQTAVNRDNAIGQRVDNVITDYQGRDSATNTRITQQVTALSDADRALGTRSSALEAAASSVSTSIVFNDNFNFWPDGFGLPSRWGYWATGGNFRTNRLAPGRGGGQFCVQTLNDVAEVDSGFVQTIYTAGAGKWVIEVTVNSDTSGLRGAGVTLHGIWSIDFLSDPDVNGRVGDSFGEVRSWSKMVDLDGRDTINVHAMHGWSGFGRGMAAKYMVWHRLAVRPATDGEIKAGKADAALNNPGGVLARISANESVLADLPNRYATAQRASNIEASVGQVGGRIGAVETVTSNGTFATASRAEQIASYAGGVNARVDVQAGTIAGLGQKTAAYVRVVADAGGGRAALSLWSDQYGGAWSLTGDGLIDGNLTINGTLKAKAFDRTSMSRYAQSVWTGALTPSAGSRVMVPWSLGLSTIAPVGRFIYEFVAVVSSNEGQRQTSTRNGKPYYIDYVPAGGGLEVICLDPQGNGYRPRANGSDLVLATADFAPLFQASIGNGSYDTGIIDDGDYYMRQIAATYTVTRIELRLTWVGLRGYDGILDHL